MKILLMLGSPKKNGNTARLLGCVEKGLQKRGVDYESIHLQGLNISGCLGCNKCKQGENPCVIKDDMTNLSKKVLDSDVIVLATPVYFWNMTAQMKLFNDRLYGISLFFPGKKIAIISTAGGDAFDGMDLIVSAVERMCNYSDIEYIGCLYRAPVGDGEKCDDEQAIIDGDEFAEKLLKQDN